MLPENQSHSLFPPHIATLFTTNQLEAGGFRICGCGDHCRTKLFPTTAEFHFVEDKTGLHPGQWVCVDCHKYYLSKAETVICHMFSFLIYNLHTIDFAIVGDDRFKEADSMFPPPSSIDITSVDHQQIHQGISAAQCWGTYLFHNFLNQYARRLIYMVENVSVPHMGFGIHTNMGTHKPIAQSCSLCSLDHQNLY